MAAVVVRHLSSQSAHSLEGIVGFAEVAVEIPAEKIADTHFHFVYGTNVVAAVILGQQLLRHQPGRLIAFGDFEPTAHLLPSGETFFMYPPVPETIAATVQQVDSARDEDIVLDAFCFGSAPSEATETVLSAVSETGGLVVHVTPDDCDATVRDYLQREWN